MRNKWWTFYVVAGVLLAVAIIGGVLVFSQC